MLRSMKRLWQARKDEPRHVRETHLPGSPLREKCQRMHQGINLEPEQRKISSDTKVESSDPGEPSQPVR